MHSFVSATLDKRSEDVWKTIFVNNSLHLFRRHLDFAEPPEPMEPALNVEKLIKMTWKLVFVVLLFRFHVKK